MAVLKQVRSFQRPGFHADSAQDFVCYSALYGEAKAKEGGPQGEILTKQVRSPENKGIYADREQPTEYSSYISKNSTSDVNSFWQQAVSEEARNELRCKAYDEYLQTAKDLQVRCASSWHDMHPLEQRAWLANVLNQDVPSKLPIIDPTTRVKDPKTGLDIPAENC